MACVQKYKEGGSAAVMDALVSADPSTNLYWQMLEHGTLCLREFYEKVLRVDGHGHSELARESGAVVGLMLRPEDIMEALLFEKAQALSDRFTPLSEFLLFDVWHERSQPMPLHAALHALDYESDASLRFDLLTVQGKTSLIVMLPGIALCLAIDTHARHFTGNDVDPVHCGLACLVTRPSDLISIMCAEPLRSYEAEAEAMVWSYRLLE
jgi:hypothetical protein